MGVKSDKWIRKMAQEHGMITPFEPRQVKAVRRGGADCTGPLEPCATDASGAEKVVSYGTSSYGYDLRCAPDWRIFTNVNSAVVDPKALPDDAFVTSTAETIIIPPNSFVLGRSLERFKIPRDVLVICLGKSTYARCGIIVNVTPLEPEWEGFITMEFSNTTPLPAKIYANEGVAQLLFLGADYEVSTGDQLGWGARREVSDVWVNSDTHGHRGSVNLRRDICETSYADRGGKYQNQVGVTLPTV